MSRFFLCRCPVARIDNAVTHKQLQPSTLRTTRLVFSTVLLTIAPVRLSRGGFFSRVLPPCRNFFPLFLLFRFSTKSSREQLKFPYWVEILPTAQPLNLVSDGHIVEQKRDKENKCIPIQGLFPVDGGVSFKTRRLD